MQDLIFVFKSIVGRSRLADEKLMNVTFTSFCQVKARIDDSLDDYVTNIREEEDRRILTIKDVKYHHEYHLTPDNNIQDLPWQFPNAITIIVMGKELQDYMRCSAAWAYGQQAQVRGIIKKETHYQERLYGKGFILEPLSTSVSTRAPISLGNTSVESSSIPADVPRLAAYRANIGGDNAFEVRQTGIASFFTASSSAYGKEAARKSITCVFVASNESPFVAFVRKKGKMFKVICDSSGIKEESQDKENSRSKRIEKKTKEDPLEVLRLRLAKGEITKQQYDELYNALVASAKPV